ncbi:MAG: hypothetical protein O9264_16270 [Leptospira sp.]|nr:hypothetical protein [Leptospira sp.]
MAKYQFQKDRNEFFHILEDYDLICSLPIGNLVSDISNDHSLKKIQELVRNSESKVCFNCKQNLENH